MFRRRSDEVIAPSAQPAPTERVTSVLGSGVVWKGNLSGAGGVRIEGAFEGEIALRGLLAGRRNRTGYLSGSESECCDRCWSGAR